MKETEHEEFVYLLTVVWVELVDVLVTTFTVEGGVVVTLLEVMIVVLSLVVSLLAVELVPVFDVDVCVVVRVDDGVCVVELVFGFNESITPMGPDKSTSLSGHVNSSG